MNKLRMVGGPPMAASLTPPPEGRRHTHGPRSGVGVARGMFDVLKDREGSDLDRPAHWAPAPPCNGYSTKALTST